MPRALPYAMAILLLVQPNTHAMEQQVMSDVDAPDAAAVASPVPQPKMMFSCFPAVEEGSKPEFPFNESTEWCRGTIFKYKGAKNDSLRNSFRKAMTKSGMNDMSHIYIWFPDQDCSVGLRKIEARPDGNESPPVFSTPDVYKSHQCYEDGGVRKPECTDSLGGGFAGGHVGDECVREPLGPVRLALMRKLSESGVENLPSRSGNTWQERRLHLDRSSFSYLAHFKGDPGTAMNCNRFAEQWVENPEKLFELFTGGHAGGQEILPS